MIVRMGTSRDLVIAASLRTRYESVLEALDLVFHLNELEVRLFQLVSQLVGLDDLEGERSLCLRAKRMLQGKLIPDPLNFVP